MIILNIATVCEATICQGWMCYYFQQPFLHLFYHASLFWSSQKHIFLYKIKSDIPHKKSAHLTIKVQFIQNTAHRLSTQVSYTIGLGTTMQENQPAAKIAASHKTTDVRREFKPTVLCFHSSPVFTQIHSFIKSCRASVVLWLTISPPWQETPGSIPISTKKIHDIYGAIWGMILCLAAICAACWFSGMVVPEPIV